MLFTNFEKYLEVRKGAIHVGAHEGQERDWYVAQGFTPVLWFEPNVKLFDRLIKNISTYENQVAYNIGIHDTLQKANLHISSNDGQSSSILELGTHKKYYPDVKYVKDQEITLMRLDKFLQNHAVDVSYNFLNIDVQGVELNVIKSFGKLVSKLDYIYLEVNEEEVYVGCSQLSDVDTYLKQYGFIRMAAKIDKTRHWGDAFYKRY